jgi:hypothetical protein
MQMALCYWLREAQGMIDKLIEIGRFYGMDVNVENAKAMRN